MLTVLVEETPKEPKPKRTMLALLVVLFVISYGLLVELVIEQDRTITAQRSLVHQLFGDSMELQSLKGKNLQRDRAHIRKGVPQPKMQAPSSQEKVEDSVPSKTKSGKLQKSAPLKPPKDASDRLDERRLLNLT